MNWSGIFEDEGPHPPSGLSWIGGNENEGIGWICDEFQENLEFLHHRGKLQSLNAEIQKIYALYGGIHYLLLLPLLSVPEVPTAPLKSEGFE